MKMNRSIINPYLIERINVFNQGSDIYMIEEMAELVQAFMKHRRGEESNIEEELADVYCTLMEYCAYYGISEKQLVQMSENKIKKALDKLEGKEC